MKHFIQLMLTMIVAFVCSIAANAYTYDFEVDGIYYNITSEKNKLCKVTVSGTPDHKYKGDIVIPDIVKGHLVVGIELAAFNNCQKLTSVTIPNTVLEIGAAAFSGCSKLQHVKLPDKLSAVGEYAFSGCESLPVENGIRYADTYLVEAIDKTLEEYDIKEGTRFIGSGAFRDCENLTTVSIPDGVVQIGDVAFAECLSLSSVSIPSSVNAIGDQTFRGCQNLPVENGIRYADTYLVKATDKTQSQYDIKDGTKFIGEEAFMCCYQLSSIDLPETLLSIGYQAFYYCGELKEIDIPHSVKAIGDLAFEGCSSLSSVSLPKSLTKINNSVFACCTSLTSIDLPANLTEIGIASFAYCESLETILIPDKVSILESSVFNNCPNLKTVNIPASVTQIGDYAFNDCPALPVENGIRYADTYLVEVVDKSLSEYEIKDGTRFIGSKAFRQCENLATMTLSPNIAGIGECAFEGCTSLATVNNYSLLNIEKGSTDNGWVGYYAEQVNTLSPDAGKETLVNKVCYTLQEDMTACVSPYYDYKNLVDVVIPATITYNNRNYTVTSVADEAFKSLKKLKSVILPETVTSIGEEAFYGCSALENIYIPQGVTEISYGAFNSCYALKSVNLPRNLTTVQTNAFNFCTALESIVLPETVTTIGWSAFMNCSSLQSVVLPASLKSIGASAFYFCSSLATVYNFSNIKLTPGSDAYGYVAYYATKVVTKETLVGETIAANDFNYTITSDSTCEVVAGDHYHEGDVVIPDDVELFGQKYAVTAIGTAAFANQTEMNYIQLPSGLEEIKANAFAGSGLKEVVVPATVTVIGPSSFSSCTKLTSVSLPHGITSIGEFAFSRCSSLWEITIPENVTTIGQGAFRYCRSLSSVTLPESLETIGDMAFGYCRNLGSIDLPKNVKSVGCYAFEECTMLQQIVLPAGVTSVSNSCFYGCLALESVTLPKGITHIGENAFSGCQSLTAIQLPESLLSIGCSAFSRCTAIGTLWIPNTVTEISQDAFSGCSALEHIEFGDKLSSIGHNAFEGCKSLAAISLPESLQYIGDRAFMGCCGLHDMKLQDGLLSIGDYAFAGCEALEQINIPYSVVRLGEDILCNTAWWNNQADGFVYLDACLLGYKGYVPDLTRCDIIEGTRLVCTRAFAACDYITKVSIPNSVTIICDAAFAKTQLCSITIPESVTYLGTEAFFSCNELQTADIRCNASAWCDYIFEGCDALMSIKIHSKTPPASAYNFGFTENTYTNANLIVPYYAVSDYEQAKDWNWFQNMDVFYPFTMSLHKGWNWITYNPADRKTINPAAVIAKLDNKVQRFVGLTQELVRDAKFGVVGNLTEIEPTHAYKLQMDSSVKINMEGEMNANDSHEIQLHEGWNWIGYTLPVPMGVNDALSDFSPAENDMIKGLDCSATYTADGWVGDLQMLSPGEGYMYHSANNTSFRYPARAAGAHELAAQKAGKAARDLPWSYDAHKYPDNATVIARLMVDNAENYTVGAFVDDECRGAGAMVGGRIFLTVHGDAGDERVAFRAFDNVTGEEFDVKETVSFSDSIVGTYGQPFALHISGMATGIADLDTDTGRDIHADIIHTVSGVKVSKISSPGIYIRNGRKVVVK